MSSRPHSKRFPKAKASQKRVEEALRKSEVRLQNILETSPDAITVTDLGGKILRCNSANVKMFGYNSEKELIGRSAFAHIVKSERKRAKESLQKTLETGKSGIVEYECITKEKKRILVELNAVLLQDAKGKPLEFVAIIRDITERVKAQELGRILKNLSQTLSSTSDLKRALKLCLETALDTSGMDSGGIYLVDQSSGDLELLYSKGLSCDFVKSATHYKAKSPNARLVMKGKPVYTKHRDLGTPIDKARKNEKLRAIGIVPILDEEKVIACLNIASHSIDKFPAAVRNVVESIAAQIGGSIARLAAQETKTKYSFIANSAKDFMTLIGKKEEDYIYEAVNNSYCEAHGKKREEIVGKSMADVWGRNRYVKNVKSQIDRCFRGNVIQYQEWFEFASLGLRYFDVMYYPYKDKGGKVSHAVVVSRDITELERSKDRIEHLNSVLRAIRDINQLIVKEEDRDKLLKGACENLIRTRSYNDAMIFLLGEDMSLLAGAEAGIGKKFEKMCRWMQEKGFFSHFRKIMKKSILVQNKSHSICAECPLFDLHSKSQVIKVPLKHNKKSYGLLSVSTPQNLKIDAEEKELLKEIAEDIGYALNSLETEEQRKNLKKITDRVVFMDPAEFQRKVETLGGKSFKAAYLVADAVDSVKQGINQARLQRYLKGIVIKHGAIWGNAWGDMIHCVFSDDFLQTTENELIAAYAAAIEICKTIKQKMGYTMRVGIASGPITTNKDTIQMNQYGRARVIEKSSIAQEGRSGITTLQRPTRGLKKKIKKSGYSFKHTKDIVRGKLKSVWKLYPVEREAKSERKRRGIDEKLVQGMCDGKCNKSEIEKLSYETSLKTLLTKGVCGHGHFEGSPFTSEVGKVLRKAGKLYEKEPKLEERFFQLTGKEPIELLKRLDLIESWGEERRRFDFVKHFLPWLYLMKMGEGSSPDIIYELTKAQLEHDLAIHAGVTREIYPLVWQEMGLDFEECIAAFVRGVEDSLAGKLRTGPINIGVGVKRQHLARKISDVINPFLTGVEYPYLKSLDVISALKQSKVSGFVEIFVNVVDVANINPLFGHKAHPLRGKHTRLLFEEAQLLDAKIHVHLLEEIVNTELIGKNQPRTKELAFILDLLDGLRAKNARLIHIAYWPKNLPYLEQIKKGNHEIAVCQTSTKMLGATHKPRSPFLLENKKAVEGMIYEDDFPSIIISTDNSGPFSIRNVWEELIVIYNDLTSWHGKELADLAFVQFLRNWYHNSKPSETTKTYHLDQNAVEWVQGYDIYDKKTELKDMEKRKQVQKRVKDILDKRRTFLKK